MTTRRRIKVVPANGVNLLCVVNQNLLDNFRRSSTPDLQLPPLYDRAVIVHFEQTVMPVVDTQQQE